MSDTQALSVNVAGHCRAINALADKLANAERKVDEYQRAIGQYIAAIKKECPDDWQSIIEEHCKIGRSRAYELLAIASDKKTVEQVRAADAEKHRRLRNQRRAESGTSRTALVKAEQASDNSLGKSGKPEEPTDDPAASAEAMKTKLAAFDTAAAPPINTKLSRKQRLENAAAEARRLASQLAAQLHRDTAYALHKFLEEDVSGTVFVLADNLGCKLGIVDHDDDDQEDDDVDAVTVTQLANAARARAGRWRAANPGPPQRSTACWPSPQSSRT